MFQKIVLGTFHALTSVHVGTGSDIGVINLPIQRERHTTFPKMEASGIKGCLRGMLSQRQEEGPFQGVDYDKSIQLIFGSEHNADHAGALAITDARCLFFPVKSAKGIFAWVTCPFVLERLLNDLKLTGAVLEEVKIPEANTVSEKSGSITVENKILLEEMVYEVTVSPDVDQLIEFIRPFLPAGTSLDNMLPANTVVLDNDSFTNIVNLCTEVTTRIKINSKTGTVTDQALFQEEMLPAETIMYSLFMTSRLFTTERETLVDTITGNGGTEEAFASAFLKEYLRPIIQIGGDTSLGKGFMTVKINWEEEARND